jgi:hypothetical protein
MSDAKDQMDLRANLGPRVSPRKVWAAIAMATVATVLLVTHLVAASSSVRLGYLGYGNSGVSGNGGYVIGSPFSVMTPPLVNLGHAPLTLKSIDLVATGCRATTVSSVLYRFNGAGVEFGPGWGPRSTWGASGLKTPAGQLRGTVLRPGTEWTPGFKDVLTLVIPHPGAVLIAGFKITYETGGDLRSQILVVPQAYLPYQRSEARTAADFDDQMQVLNSLRISKQGTPSSRPCDYIHS